MRFAQVTQRLGHRVDWLFRPDIYKIPEYDALFIRSLTDPLNASYVAARTADLHGLRVIDDPDSIIACCDKVNMYRRLLCAGVPIPDTVFLGPSELTADRGADLLRELGSPLVLKAPSSSFSMYVERVTEPSAFVRVSRRFLRRADLVVAQRFVQSVFDWRVGVLGGDPLFVCRYVIPKRRWKVLSYTESGRMIYGAVQSVPLSLAAPRLLDVAVQAAATVGRGLYGVDLKQIGDDYVVLEVNDNPTIAANEEDVNAPQVYERVIRYLVGEWG